MKNEEAVKLEQSDVIMSLAEPDGEEVFTLTTDGKLKLAPKFENHPDEATKLFWSNFALSGVQWLNDERSKILEEEIAKYECTGE